VQNEPSSLSRPAPRGPALIQRLLDGDPAAEDIVIEGVRRAVMTGETFEATLGLFGAWRKHLHLRRIEASAASLPPAKSKLAGATQIRSATLRYAASARYEVDLALGAPVDPEDALAFALLQANGGCVPSLSTIRRLTEQLLKIADAMSNVASEHDA
jgi:hypothetical protein